VVQFIFDLGQIFLATYALTLVMPIFWVVLFLVFMQYRRVAATEESLYGRVINPIGRQMLTSLGLGLLGGFIASVILVLLGLSLEQIGLYFIWPVALLLLLINPRYLCFSYAGGIVAVAVLLVKYILLPLFPGLIEIGFIDSLLKIHIPALLVLIGLLHLVEAMLIYIGGHWGSSPIYLKQDDGKVVGAYTLQRFWPLPLVALLVTLVAQTEIVGVTMPDWWPILKSVIQPGEEQSLQYMVIPVAAGLGYSDLAFTAGPREKTLFSSKWLALYSIILLIIGVTSEYLSFLILPGVIFAPLGHELLILYGKKRDAKNNPCYRADGEGVILLMVVPGTAAEEAGLKTGDRITRINSDPVNGGEELLRKIDDSYFLVLLEGFRGNEAFSLVLKKKSRSEGEVSESFQSKLNKSTFRYLLQRGAALGVIPVPSDNSPVYLQLKRNDTRTKFNRLKLKLSNLFRRAG
jgi:hypothetical protein